MFKLNISLFIISFLMSLSVSATSVTTKVLTENLFSGHPLEKDYVVSRLKMAAVLSGLSYIGKEEKVYTAEASEIRFYFQHDTIVDSKPVHLTICADAILVKGKINSLSITGECVFTQNHGLDLNSETYIILRDFAKSFKEQNIELAEKGLTCVNRSILDLQKLSLLSFQAIRLENIVEDNLRQTVRYTVKLINENKTFGYELHMFVYSLQNSGLICFDEPKIFSLKSKHRLNFQSQIEVESEILKLISAYKKSLISRLQ